MLKFYLNYPIYFPAKFFRFFFYLFNFINLPLQIWEWNIPVVAGADLILSHILERDVVKQAIGWINPTGVSSQYQIITVDDGFLGDVA